MGIRVKLGHYETDEEAPRDLWTPIAYSCIGVCLALFIGCFVYHFAVEGTVEAGSPPEPETVASAKVSAKGSTVTSDGGFFVSNNWTGQYDEYEPQRRVPLFERKRNRLSSSVYENLKALTVCEADRSLDASDQGLPDQPSATTEENSK